MEKKIENYLHFYLGCEVIADIYRGNVKAILNGVSFEHDSNSVRIRTLSCLEYLPASKIKLILRNFSEITDEEFYELVMLRYYNYRDIAETKIKKIERRVEYKQNIKFGTSIPYSAFGRTGEHEMSGTVSTESLSSEQYKYLLSQNFDLFGLIESGLAIDKTTVDNI